MTSLPVTASATASRPDDVAGRLEAARRVIEQRFLEAGNTLSDAVESVGELIASLDRMAAAVAPQVVESTTAELADAAQVLSSLPGRHAERFGRLETMGRTADGLTASVDAMRQDLAYLRVFAINIKITAGGIAAAGEEFGIFAQEIHDCIDLGRSKLDGFAGDAATLREGIAAALAQGGAMGGRFDELVPSVPDALVANAGAMSQHHERIGEAAAGVAALAREVQRKVGAALSALQIGDITRQRIEHVQAGLSLLEAAAAPLPPEQRARIGEAVRHLLARQLEATAEGFHREVERIGGNMAGLAEDARELLRLRDLAYGGARNGDDGFLRSLEANVDRALQLVGDVEAAERAAGEVGQAAASAAQALTASVAGLQAIRRDVQQMALNTTLKCARIGETGRPLGVIAIELRHHAGRLEESAGQALATLQDLEHAAASAVELEPEAGAGAAAVALEGATARIHGAAEAVESDLAALAERGAAIVDALTRASGGVALQAEIGTVLDTVAAEVAISTGPAGPLDDAAEAALIGLLGTLRTRYTMAGERQIHDAIVADLGLVEPEPALMEAVG